MSLNRRQLGAICLVLALGYLIVGWWPFAFRPVNRVSWLSDRPGLRFEKGGICLEAESPLSPGDSNTADPATGFTIELWAEAESEAPTDVFHLLTVHDGRLPSPFVLCQWKQHLVHRVAATNPNGTRVVRERGLKLALVARQPKFFTISGDEAGTDLHLDGVLAGNYPGFISHPQALGGRLILGNAATGKHSWRGRIFGLAIYQRKLESKEIAQHYSTWTNGQAGELAKSPGLIALYPFTEGAGTEVLDHSGHQRKLTIPPKFWAPQKEWLIPPWNGTLNLRRDFRDILVNILGFAPFGFCFQRYLQSVSVRSWWRGALAVILAGGGTSLMIETVQVWLPNRFSSLTDLFCNTAGALLGLLLARIVCSRLVTKPSARVFHSRCDRIG